MTHNDALVVVLTRNAFYKQLYYFMLATFALSLVVIAILIGIITFLIKNPIQPLYFATDEIGRLIQDTPVNQSDMSLDEVMAWVVEAVQSSYSYDYINYRLQLQSAQKYFTNYGWQNYMSALTASNNLLAVTQRKMIVLARVVGKPALMTQGILAGAYAWKFKMPLLVTNWSPPYNEKSKSLNALTVTVIVQRQPVLQSDKGLGIVQFVAQAATSTQPSDISLIPAG
ncbi:MAG TPA: DotI/IcmL/TraM family protein [Gammaproteobacteria bacterium]|nr:DotI/IcmL/TraM family protein [Gammaproteobacteria bacterium]